MICVFNLKQLQYQAMYFIFIAALTTLPRSFYAFRFSKLISHKNTYSTAVSIIKSSQPSSTSTTTTHSATASFQLSAISSSSSTTNIDHHDSNTSNEYHDHDATVISRKVFCNVELNGEAMEAIGFDMDFTLAQYKPAFDLLAFEGAKNKLYTSLGYPKDVLGFQYSAESFRRGLVIDKKEGNILKLDRHKYHRKVFHGLTELDTEQRKHCKYSKHAYSYSESEFIVIDTLFLLVDVVLFANLVDFRDKNLHLLGNKTYADIYSDIRECVDLCHRDGVIKDAVIKNPSEYIVYDSALVPMLQRFRHEKKKLFLLTNSMWEYTNNVMKYLVHGSSGNLYPDISSWESLFDVVIVGAAKPGFLTDEYLTLFRIDESDGLLRNIEDKANLNSVFIAGSGGRRVFQGGHWQDLQKLLAISAGDKILYVGDHMYADILKSKRNLGWRTCLIIPELDNELIVGKQNQELGKKLLHLRQVQYDLDEYMDLLRQKSQLGATVGSQLQEAESKASELKHDVRRLTEEYNSQFNSIWGPLFKAGYQDSRFAKQVCDYACLYTSRASNLGFISPSRRHRTMQAFMPHDQIALDTQQFHADYDI